MSIPVRATSPVQRLSAIQIITDEHGRETMGLVTQLPKSSDLQLCGQGFSDRTVKVNYHGLPYFVFREDLERLKT